MVAELVCCLAVVSFASCARAVSCHFPCPDPLQVAVLRRWLTVAIHDASLDLIWLADLGQARCLGRRAYAHALLAVASCMTRLEIYIS